MFSACAGKRTGMQRTPRALGLVLSLIQVVQIPLPGEAVEQRPSYIHRAAHIDALAPRTIFHFVTENVNSLPTVRVTRQAATQQSPAIVSILVVDDIKYVLGTAEMILKSWNTPFAKEIVTVAIPEVALDLLGRLRQTGLFFDVLITDYQMPGLTGPDFWNRAKQVLEGYAPVAVLNSSDIDGVTEVGKNEFFAAVAKDFDGAWLNAIGRAIEKSRPDLLRAAA